MLGDASPGLHWSPEIVDAFVASPLARRLGELKLHDGAIDAAGIARLKAAALPVKLVLS
jgi:hypothetical protein